MPMRTNSIIDLTGESPVRPASPLPPLQSHPLPSSPSRHQSTSPYPTFGQDPPRNTTLNQTPPEQTAGPSYSLRRPSSGSSIVALAESPPHDIRSGGRTDETEVKDRLTGRGKRKTSEPLKVTGESSVKADTHTLVSPDRDESAEQQDEGLLSSFQCPICLEPPAQAVLTPCGHVSESPPLPCRIY